MKTFNMLAVLFSAVALTAGGRATGEPAPTVASGDWVVAYQSDFKNAKATEADWRCRLGEMKTGDGKLVLLPKERKKRIWLILDPLVFPGSFRVEITGSVIAGAKPESLGFNICINTYRDEVSSGYLLQFGAKGNTCSLLRRNGKVVEETINRDVRPVSGRSYDIVAEKVDGRISLWVDGTLAFSYTDPAPLGDATCDSLGLHAQACTLSMEKIAIRTRQGHPEDVYTPLTAPAGSPQVALKGMVVWEQNPSGKDGIGSHQVLYAMEGTTEIAATWEKLMRDYWPGEAMDCDQARQFDDGVTKLCKYYLAPHQAATRQFRIYGHYSAYPVEVTGTAFEKGGRRWLIPTGIKDTKLVYPEKMLALDKPFAMPGKEPLVLKIDDKLSLKCVLLPAGRYLQGAPYYQLARAPCEDPHEVVLTKAFWMAEIPVTQEMFESVTGKNPCRGNPKCNLGPQCPVEVVPYAAIEEFCRIVSERNHRRVRLPTYGEWEYADRVGTSSPCFVEKYRDQVSNIGADTKDDPAMRNCPVKTAKPSAWGLYDMLTCGEHQVSDWGRDNSHEKEVDPIGPTRNEAWGGNDPIHLAAGFRWGGARPRPNILGCAHPDGQGYECLTIFRVAVDATPEEIAEMEKQAKK